MPRHLHFLLLVFGFLVASPIRAADPTYLVLWPQPGTLCQQPLVIGLSQREGTIASDLAADPHRVIGSPESNLWNALNDQRVTIVLDPRIAQALRSQHDAKKEFKFRSVPKHPQFPLLSELAAYAGMVQQIVGRDVCYEPLWFGTVNRRARAIWPDKEPVQLGLTFVSEDGLRDPESALIGSIRRYSMDQPKSPSAIEELMRLWKSNQGSEREPTITFQRDLRAFLIRGDQKRIERFAYELGAP